MGYRAILLEPTLAGIFSRTWRSRIAEGLAQVSAGMQWGGRKGWGISPLHVQVRLWQSTAKHSSRSLALLFVDLRQAFYSVVKPMLATCDGSDESVASIFQVLNLPPSAYHMFLRNVGNGDMIRRATHSPLLADYVGANLASTWFAVPNGQGISAPQTGSRPGDPCADLLFGFVMAQMLANIHERAGEAGIPLHQKGEDGVSTHCVTWVDGVALAVMEEAENLAAATSQLLSIVMDVALEHGMRMSYGQGKAAAAVILEFKGKEAKKHRQSCEKGR